MPATIVVQTTYLVAELPATGFVTERFTREIAGSRVDALTLSSQATDGLHSFTGLMHMRGFPANAMAEILAEMKDRYDDLQVLVEGNAASPWLVRTTVASNSFRARPLLFMARLQADFGSLWSHVSDGKFQMRAAAPDVNQASEAAGRLESYYLKAGVPVQVAIREMPPSEMVIWQKLNAQKPARTP